jgi:DnaK suppressor protein
MDTQEQQKYKEIIEAQIAELRRSLSQPDDAAGTVSLNDPIGRLTRVDALQAQQMALELRRRRQARLTRLERALRLIAEGEYGTCSKCGEDIPKARLELYPDVRMCVECASKMESTRPWG